MEGKGVIFNVQRFSIHDGPGIRTAVFFKGCPLRCPWCSNPESQSAKVEMTWDRKKCISCGTCLSACGRDDIHMVEPSVTSPHGEDKKLIVFDRKNCNVCMMCKEACPTGAISYEGTYRTTDEIMEIVMKDEPFYAESGGGITLTGGEVLAQPVFADELLTAAKTKGLHTAMETTCYGPKDKFIGLLRNLDLLLCDIKHWDSDKHEAFTGVPLGLIQDNIRAASNYPTLQVIGRVPVIPGFNYTPDDAAKLSETILGLGVRKVHLLRYHSFGEGKYELLGRKYEMDGISQIHRDDPLFEEYSDIFRKSGLEVS